VRIDDGRVSGVGGAELLDAAESALRAGGDVAPMTVLIGYQGGIRIVCNTDRPMYALQAEHGADMTYRVSQSGGRVRVEGQGRGQRCVMESGGAAVAARLLLGGVPPAYSITAAA